MANDPERYDTSYMVQVGSHCLVSRPAGYSKIEHFLTKRLKYRLRAVPLPSHVINLHTVISEILIKMESRSINRLCLLGFSAYETNIVINIISNS